MQLPLAFPFRPASCIVPALAAALLLAAAGAPAQTGAPAARQSKAIGIKPAPRPAAPARADGTERQQRELQSEQKQLRSKLAQLKRQLATAETTHSEATDSLRESEAAISAANRRLRELAQSRRQVERQIAALQERRRTAGTRQGSEERQLAQVLRAQVALVQQSRPPAQPHSQWHWQQLLADDPQRAARDLAYLDYVARARLQAIGQLRERREELAALETESRAKQAELAAIAGDEQASRAQLLREQQARRRTLDRLARQIGAQRQSIATLERDERRLGSLITELNKLLAEQVRRERQRAAQAARAAAEPRTPPPAANADSARATEPPTDGRFAQLRGKLLLPVRGEVGARFGAARRTEAGVDAPTWKGVFIRAAAGSDVHAAAAGRVVFADWLRGFGNLLILDHGEGYLSVYGNNESLLAAVGERVDAGEVIAAVGNTGGSSESGLYFELRFQGRPFDPLRWAQAR